MTLKLKIIWANNQMVFYVIFSRGGRILNTQTRSILKRFGSIVTILVVVIRLQENNGEITLLMSSGSSIRSISLVTTVPKSTFIIQAMVKSIISNWLILILNIEKQSNTLQNQLMNKLKLLLKRTKLSTTDMNLGGLLDGTLMPVIQGHARMRPRTGFLTKRVVF